MFDETSEWIPIDPEISRMLEERVYEFESPVALDRTEVINYLRKKSGKRVIAKAGTCESTLDIEDLHYKIRIIFNPTSPKVVASPPIVELTCTSVRPATETSEEYMKTCAKILANSLPRRSRLEMKYIEPTEEDEGIILLVY